ncbi:MAG: diaminopimelate epimerase [Bacteroidia bacterium]|nr:diaminopimelate epimerase [Bacteroidia bacterium]
MRFHFSKYHGTGNDFIIIDNRTFFFEKANHELIAHLCHRRFGIGADGVLLLEPDDETGFRMIYFNADGRPGTMCGNGARCLVAFAHRLLNTGNKVVFSASDGRHEAEIISIDENLRNYTVKLRMNDVSVIESFDGGFVLNTGSPHFVTAEHDPYKTDVVSEGRRIRNSERFRQEGINVNFIKVEDGKVHLRTYERGVEDETWSCGTGSVAAALTALHAGLTDKSPVQIIAKGGSLKVFAESKDKIFKNIYLEGIAQLVYEGSFCISDIRF